MNCCKEFSLLVGPSVDSCPDWTQLDWSYGPLTVDGTGSSFTPTSGNANAFTAVANTSSPDFSYSANAATVNYSGLGCTGNAHVVFSKTADPGIPGYGVELRNADTNDIYWSFYEDEHANGTYDEVITIPVLGAPVNLIVVATVLAAQNETISLQVTFT